ncbi:uncharacterized protein [Spinacia oleracea]|uniref:Peptidase A2 domain-containing protein n=1 Tax=Spinacia oleracea TaxID=3562 RepID=A0ABM3QRP3_SPIOL|nr:uncharacterized protein LOC130461825 [Spinacia oleracea]
MDGNATSSDDITRRFEAMEQRINILQKQNEALHSQIREFDPLPNQPRSNPSWLPPPPTQPSSAGTSTTVVTSTAARVTPPQVGMTTSTMVTAPAPVSRPLPPPMVPTLLKERPLTCNNWCRSSLLTNLMALLPQTKRHARENEIDRPVRAVAAKYLTPTSFDESDAGDVSDKHHDGLVISIPVGNYMIKRVLVDNGSSTNVMMLDALKEMGLNPDTYVVKKSIVLIGFSGEAKTTFGEVTLPVYA